MLAVHETLLPEKETLLPEKDTTFNTAAHVGLEEVKSKKSRYPQASCTRHRDRGLKLLQENQRRLRPATRVLVFIVAKIIVVVVVVVVALVVVVAVVVVVVVVEEE